VGSGATGDRTRKKTMPYTNAAPSPDVGRRPRPAGCHSRAGSSHCARIAHLVAACVLAASAGCSSVNPRDPLEPYNRTMYGFNDAVDQNVLKPVAEGYRSVVPQIVRTGVRNFFSNIEDVWIGVNNLLQFKVGDALTDWTRFLMNTTFGIAGLYDVASEAGLDKHNEDFGQTLGWWGIPPGPYLVLPLLGPSTFRDAPAVVVDASTSAYGVLANAVSPDNANALRFGLLGLNLVNKRADALGATTIIDQAALDRYAFTRDAFLQRRRNLVYDGDPPREKDPDDDARLAPGTEFAGAPHRPASVDGPAPARGGAASPQDAEPAVAGLPPLALPR